MQLSDKFSSNLKKFLILTKIHKLSTFDRVRKNQIERIDQSINICFSETLAVLDIPQLPRKELEDENPMPIVNGISCKAIEKVSDGEPVRIDCANVQISVDFTKYIIFSEFQNSGKGWG